jgi:hypothetical protein
MLAEQHLADALAPRVFERIGQPCDDVLVGPPLAEILTAMGYNIVGGVA